MTTAFRPVDPFQVFTDQYGKLNVGGQLVFFLTGTTTPKEVFSDPNLTASLGNTVQIGTDGRPVSDIWGSDAYRVRMLDVNGVQIGPDRDEIAIPGGGAAALPTPFIPNALLSNDGSLPLWLQTILMPDPTGHANNSLGTDGTAVFWEPKPGAVANGITVATNSAGGVTITGTAGGTNPKFMIQTGNGSAPASGSSSTNATITFPTAFSGTPQVFCQLATGSAQAQGLPTIAALSPGSTGFQAFCNAQVKLTDGGAIIGAVAFNWVAIGLSP